MSTRPGAGPIGPARSARAVLGEMVGYLALVATRRHYDEQPDLWRLGEHGRARTLEDYEHHFRAVANLEEVTWRRHVDYCERLFAEREYPRRWLLDAWRIMGDTLRAEVDAEVADQALALLASTPTERGPEPPATPGGRPGKKG